MSEIAKMDGILTHKHAAKHMHAAPLGPLDIALMMTAVYLLYLIVLLWDCVLLIRNICQEIPSRSWAKDNRQ